MTASPFTIKNLLVTGLAGQIAFEAYAWLVSPMLFGVALQPTNLVLALAQVTLGLKLPYWLGFVLHFAIGAIGFTALVVLTHRVSRASLIVSGVAVGLGLWFVAQGLLAQVVGRSFMMGFGSYTQSSFVAHVGMTTLMAFFLLKLGTARRQSANGKPAL